MLLVMPCLMLCLGPALAAGAEGAGIRVYASIPPLEYLVEQVGGSRVDVEVVVEAGQRAETYEPTPRQLGGLARADAFFGVGMPLEAAWRRQLQDTGSSPQKWIDLAAALQAPEETHAHDHEEHDDETHHDGDGPEGHRHEDGLDPHIWLSPDNARRMATTIADVLGRLEPRHADDYAANAARLRAALQSLDEKIAALLAESAVETFLVYHSAWGHFARHYGLTQIAIEAQGKEPGPRSLAEVISKAKEQGIRTVFVDASHSRRLAETVADAIGARLEVLEPLAYDYPDNLLRAARAISESRS